MASKRVSFKYLSSFGDFYFFDEFIIIFAFKYFLVWTINYAFRPVYTPFGSLFFRAVCKQQTARDYNDGPYNLREVFPIHIHIFERRACGSEVVEVNTNFTVNFCNILHTIL